jgi:hypothetical protein
MRYMVKLMIQSFLNRNNREFFINGNKYWEWKNGEQL